MLVTINVIDIFFTFTLWYKRFSDKCVDHFYFVCSKVNNQISTVVLYGGQDFLFSRVQVIQTHHIPKITYGIFPFKTNDIFVHFLQNQHLQHEDYNTTCSCLIGQSCIWGLKYFYIDQQENGP